MTSDELLAAIRLNGAVPRHVAIIMDGNGRWARERHLPRALGHRNGMKSVREAVEGSIQAGVEVLSLFAFSQENWQRPATEVTALMSLLEEYIAREQAELIANGVRVRVLGDLERLTPAARQAVDGVVAATAPNDRLTVQLFISYGARAELVRAARRLAEAAADGRLDPADIDEDTFRAHLYTERMPGPGSPDPHVRRAAHLELHALAARVHGAAHHSRDVARLHSPRPVRGDSGVPEPRAAVRQGHRLSGAPPVVTAASTSAPERVPSGQGGLSNLAQRILFALGAIPVVLGAVWIGDWALAGVLAIASALAAWEFYRIAEQLGTRPMARAGIAFAALLPLAIHARYLGLPVDAVVSLPFAAVVVLALFGAVDLRPRRQRDARWSRCRSRCSASCTPERCCRSATRCGTTSTRVGRIAGTSLLMFALALVWISDTAAYVVGRALGKRKLIPAVSPGKTVAGAVGALVTCAVASWALVRFVLVPFAQLGLRPIHAVLFGVAVSVATQLGDLAESLIKREAGVKDSSHIIPGHGGVLDRIDGLLFALPVAYWLLTAWLVPVPR